MLVLRGFGLAGLGVGDVPPASSVPLTEGYCFKDGAWMWTTAAQCPRPLMPGGAQTDKPGYCWNQLSPPNAFPGYWSRSSGSCQFPGPPSPPSSPNEPAGFCRGADGIWRWTLQSLCPVPVQQGTDPDRDHRGDGQTAPGVTVTDTVYTGGAPITLSALNRLYKKTFENYHAREIAAVKAWAASGAISPCPPETVKPPACIGCAETCYTFSPTTMAATIPGAFEVFGVPFNIAEPGIVKSPQFERVYTPNNEQRILIEGRIVLRSMALLEPALKLLKDLSVNEALAKLGPRWVIAAPNVSFRSDPPKAAELTSRGGFGKFIKRGFLISLEVTEGKTTLTDDPTCPMACIGNKCRCGNAALPACIGAGVATSDDDPNLSTGCFYWYAQALPNRQMKLIGKHDDPSWLERAGSKVAGVITAIGNAVCGAQPVIQSQMQSAVAERCVDKSGKPCTKGATGCTCISPSAATQGSVGLFNFVAGKFCQGWAAEQNPKMPLPPVPDPPAVELPKPLWMTLLPWIAGGLAIGAGGAYAFSRR